MTAANPFLRHPVGNLGIHVNQKIPLLHRNQVKGCLPRRINISLHPDSGIRHQQFSASASIFHMTDFHSKVMSDVPMFTS